MEHNLHLYTCSSCAFEHMYGEESVPASPLSHFVGVHCMCMEVRIQAVSTAGAAMGCVSGSSHLPSEPFQVVTATCRHIAIASQNGSRGKWKEP